MAGRAITPADVNCDERAAERPGHPLELHGVEHLLSAVERHVETESAAMDAYTRLATSADPVVALIAGLVLDDERHHHVLMLRVAATLRDALQWTRSPDALPGDVLDAPSAEKTLSTLRALVREEHEGAAALRSLARPEVRRFDGLMALLLDLMAADSDKHEHALRFLVHRLEAAHPSPAGSFDQGEEL